MEASIDAMPQFLERMELLENLDEDEAMMLLEHTADETGSRLKKDVGDEFRQAMHLKALSALIVSREMRALRQAIVSRFELFHNH